jgi:hypothetical protein
MVAPASDRRVSARKRRANRNNAAQSTGPRSAAGKARSARNATTHGIFASHIILPGESEQLFARLQHAYIVRLAPQDLLELDLVNRIVIAQWRINRCNGAEGIFLDYMSGMARKQARDEVKKLAAELGIEQPYEDDTDVEELNEEETAMLGRLRLLDTLAGVTLPPAAHLASAMIDPHNPVERLARYEQRLQQMIHRALAELEKLRGRSRREWDDLPPSPFLAPAPAPAPAPARDANDEDDATECNQSQPAATESSPAQNEPTTGGSPPSPAAPETCDAPRAPNPVADPVADPAPDAPDAPDCPAPVTELLREVLELRQDHLGDPPEESTDDA